ncbi:MAG: ATP-binding protein [Rhizobiales bacterium]|nr:ATP-binding protein [Hyphomicrobiales bacterium]
MTQHVLAEEVAQAEVVDRRSADQDRERFIGRVVSCDGAFAIIHADAVEIASGEVDYWSIGRLVSIDVADKRIVGLVFNMNLLEADWDKDTNNIMRIQAELVGEVSDGEDGRPYFDRGITTYPYLGAKAHKIRKTDLAAVHHPTDDDAVKIGRLSQDAGIAAVVCVEKLLSRHFAVVGTTGVGKSSTVALLLRQVIEVKPDLRVLMFDPHNEYSNAFSDCSVTIDNHTLDLPFWLFQHEEFAEVVFRGRPRVEEEVGALGDLIAIAKTNYANKRAQNNGIVKRVLDSNSGITADSPIPYRMSDLFALIEEEIGQLEGRYDRIKLRSLKNRLDALVNDPRYRFMFAARTIEDNLFDVVSQVFRFPHDNRPITILQLAGMPTEVVNSVVSVLCRIGFDLALWGDGACEVLMLCEEAHRYVPGDVDTGFAPTRQAIARIAKEGRKFGCYLGVVTQRPGELDATILSQCSTVFAMRLANDRDQEIIRSAIADSSIGTISFLSSIGNREAIAFGEAVMTPMRIKFSDLPYEYIPRAPLFEHASSREETVPGAPVDLTLILDRMRAMSRNTGLL